jgi:hypothetical protein
MNLNYLKEHLTGGKIGVSRKCWSEPNGLAYFAPKCLITLATECSDLRQERHGLQGG